MIAVRFVKSCHIQDLCISLGLTGKAPLMYLTHLQFVLYVHGPKQTACLSDPFHGFTADVHSVHFFSVAKLNSVLHNFY